MDILYTSLSKSNIIHEDSGGGGINNNIDSSNDTSGRDSIGIVSGGGAGGGNKKSKLNGTTTTSSTTIQTTTTAKTSTPFNADDKIKSSVAFSFISPPPNCSTLIQNQSDSKIEQQQEHKDSRKMSKYNSTIEYIMKYRGKRVDNQQIDAEIKVKENYLNHLKSIDLSKYSFPNENKPKTDYTYAHTGLYISHKNDCLDETPLEVPNLCRRARKITPQNSLLTDTSYQSQQSTYLQSFGSILNKFNLFSLFYSYLTQNRTNTTTTTTTSTTTLSNNETSSSYNQNLNKMRTSSNSHQIHTKNQTNNLNENNNNNTKKSIYYRDLYGLDDNNSVESRNNLNSVTNSSILSTANLATTRTLTNISSFNDEKAIKASKSAGVNLKSSGVNTDIDASYAAFRSNTSSKQSICAGFFKWCLLLPLLCLLILLLIPFTQKNSSTEYLQLISNSNSYDQEFIRNEITQNINLLVKNSFNEALESLKSNIPDIDKVENEIIQQLDDKLNSKLSLLLTKLNDQELQLQASKTSYDEELKQLKNVIRELQEKRILLKILLKKHYIFIMLTKLE